MRTAIIACFFAAGISIVAAPVALTAQQPSQKTEPWKSEDIIYAESAQPQARISPDAKWLVWVKSTADKEKDARVSNLILSNLTENKEIQLTRGSDNNSQPQWSPDGQLIALTSNRTRHGAKPDADSTQLWIIDAHGGEPWPLTELAHAPQHLEWIDNDTVIFSAEEDPALVELESKHKKDDSEIVDDADHKPPVRLFKISVKDKKITRLTTNTDWIANWSISKDGKYVATVHAKSLHYIFDQKVPPITILHNLSDGTEKQIFTNGRVRPYGFEWAPNNSGFYAWAPFSNHPKFLTASIVQLYFYDLAAGKSTQVPLDWENGIGSNLVATQDGFVTGLAAGHRFETSRYTRTKSAEGWTWKRAPLEGEHAKNIQSFEVSEDGKTIVYFYSTASMFPQIYRAQLEGTKLASPVQLTKLNESLAKSRAFAKTEIIRWKGANNEEVEGLLYYPTNYEPGKKYPLITAIHGGPSGHDADTWEDSWAYPNNLLTQRGAFILKPNYHGSNNYGLKWVESICCGKYYDLETPDINMGVDYLIAKGLVDPDKVATLGWSNGSILSTSLLITYPERYKAASLGAGDIEWLSDWGNVIFGDSFDSYYFGKSPMEDPQLYLQKSPMFKLEKVQAPVLIFHGTADNNVPPAQSWSYFRVLQYYGKVPVKLILFPGEPHGPQKLTHQMRKVDEEVAWFDKYFFKTAPTANEALKSGSPLEAALRAKGIARTGGVYGATVQSKGKAVLIPEVVNHNGTEVGRFEITRAQFATFEKSYKVPPGSEDFPANGITLERAKAYVEWLPKLTGQTWRLPTEKEFSGLYEKRDNENTLDYWAGYALNPDDMIRLREKAQELPGTAPLLKPVGSFAAETSISDEPVFDFGGNVAEWVETKDGKGKAVGGSADCPSDARSNCTPALEYIGFRVVRNAAPPAAPAAAATK
jgi:dipeptidyl aminopeptidase/acylaminoacyl peptidase